jgi:ABC-type amino acid transport system permease subunit
MENKKVSVLVISLCILIVLLRHLALAYPIAPTFSLQGGLGSYTPEVWSLIPDSLKDRGEM